MTVQHTVRSVVAVIMVALSSPAAGRAQIPASTWDAWGRSLIQFSEAVMRNEERKAYSDFLRAQTEATRIHTEAMLAQTQALRAQNIERVRQLDSATLLDDATYGSDLELKATGFITYIYRHGPARYPRWTNARLMQVASDYGEHLEASGVNDMPMVDLLLDFQQFADRRYGAVGR